MQVAAAGDIDIAWAPAMASVTFVIHERDVASVRGTAGAVWYFRGQP